MASALCACGATLGAHGPMAATASTRSGCSAATSSASQALEQMPTSTARSTPTASSTAMVSATICSWSYAAGSVVRSERPLPGESIVTTWQVRAR